jgi:hypothetical protein
MKFKKHISFILAFFLLVSNIGFAVDLHYCRGEVASVKPIYWKNTESLNSVNDNCCGPKVIYNVQKKDSCCKDKVVHFQKKSENGTLNSLSFNPDFICLLKEWNPIIFPEISKFEGNPITAYYYCDANAPPLFKLYHQFLFYA